MTRAETTESAVESVVAELCGEGFEADLQDLRGAPRAPAGFLERPLDLALLDFRES